MAPGSWFKINNWKLDAVNYLPFPSSEQKARIILQNIELKCHKEKVIITRGMKTILEINK